MKPYLHDGDVVLGWRRLPREGDVAIVSQGDRQVIKRVSSIKRGRYYLVGDNAEESTDSRHYGHVGKKDILGTIMFVLPRATKPPKLVHRSGVWLGRALGLFLVVMCLTHLYRIDTFIPLLDEALPSGPGYATAAALIIILTELFAIPFALRMKLSPLAHIVSGALIVFAPLWWLAIDILTLGSANNKTGQLGEFMSVPSSPEIIALNVLWLGAAYLTLYSLGYNELNLKSR